VAIRLSNLVATRPSHLLVATRRSRRGAARVRRLHQPRRAQ
jgi:hypothetical protein